MDQQGMAQIVRNVLPHAEVHPTDLAGGDHWHMVVVDASFAGQRPLQRQRVVLAAFKEHMASGTVHALDLKCLTPEELAARGMPEPFRPHGPGEGTHRSW